MARALVASIQIAIVLFYHFAVPAFCSNANNEWLRKRVAVNGGNYALLIPPAVPTDENEMTCQHLCSTLTWFRL